MRVFAVCAAASTLMVTGHAAFGAPRDAAQEAEIDRAVGAVDPALVSMVHEGNAAMDRGDTAEAVRDYDAVHTRAPDVPSVTRRLGLAEARLGNVPLGITHCRQAIAADPSAENHAALAASLLLTRPYMVEAVTEAFSEAKTAAELAPNTEYAQATLCQAALVAGDSQVLSGCASKLQKLAPDAAETHVFTAASALGRDDFDGAQRELELSRKAGLSDAAYKSMQGEIEQKRPQDNLVQQALTWTLVGFVGLLFVLFVVGMLLSDTLLARVKNPRSVSRPMRVGSRVFLTVAGLFFYVSVAILSASLAIFATVVVVVFFQLTHPSRFVQIASGVVALYVLFALVRASFSRVPVEDAGTKVDLAKEPTLGRSLDVIAKRLGQRKIAEVHVRSDASIEIIERGGIIGHLRGTSPRVLYVGAFALEGLSRQAFEALVGSEMLRFRDAGTAGAGVASSVRYATDALCDRMRARGVATASNPAWWIVAGYQMFFERISEGAIDLGEVLGDERAAALHGGDVFVSGLRHLVRRQVDVEARASEMVRDVIAPSAETPSEAQHAFDEAWLDYADRVKRIEAFEPPDETAAGTSGDGPAWELFSGRDALEHTMNAELRAAVDLEIGITREVPSP